jgi:hypothetical protein
MYWVGILRHTPRVDGENERIGLEEEIQPRSRSLLRTKARRFR